MAQKREHWSSSFGFVLAATGGAVGLGNLWKFPYIAWENNGGAFVLIYLVCIAVIGLPLMITEVVIGRSTQLSTVPAIEKLTARSSLARKFSLLAWAGVATGVLVLAFYTVIAGWSISALISCLNWSINGYEPPGEGAFGAFVSNGTKQVVYAFIFAILTAFIVYRGIAKGIERATKILMPALFLMMILLVIRSFSLDGVGQAFGFLFNTDFSKITGHGVLEALGHSFFTLSLGMGAMITYGSYMSRSESINKAALAIVALDTVVALLACIVMYTIIFSFPSARAEMGASSAGMLFVTIPKLFYTSITGGSFLAPLFYVLICFVALSSTISMLEVVVSALVDKTSLSRKRATFYSAGSIFGLTLMCALSNGAVRFFSQFNLFGGQESGILGSLNHLFMKGRSGFMNTFDHITTNWLLPVGGLCLTLFIGWYLDRELILDEMNWRGENGKPKRVFYLFRFITRFVTPIIILFIIYSVNQ